MDESKSNHIKDKTFVQSKVEEEDRLTAIANFWVMKAGSGNSATGLDKGAGKISSIETASDENELKKGFNLGRRY
ncbi:hypothetical protein F8M41_009165 [Gigaspora margarita]|uniref:Uncharacterized protein n=1 Tax=Gigaspora margarita TaxID=4874 RepID=A0A8H3X3B0_GIGMA|nr:hypothetical protein F8M41_009165 [Gigaspora margarita]